MTYKHTYPPLLPLQVCEDHGANAEALGLYQRMRKEGVDPNWITYSTIFRILLSDKSRWTEIQSLLQEVGR